MTVLQTEGTLLAWFSPALPHIAELERIWQSGQERDVASLHHLDADSSRGIDYFFCDPEKRCEWVDKCGFPSSSCFSTTAGPLH